VLCANYARASYKSYWASMCLPALIGILLSTDSGYPESKIADKPDRYPRLAVDVHGEVFARVADRQSPDGYANISLPGVAVYLRNMRGDARTANSITNLRGMFNVTSVQPGTYLVCWMADGFEPGCSGPDRPIIVRDTTMITGPVEIRPKGTFVAGSVTPCSLDEPVFGIGIATQVSLIDAAGAAVRKPVQANYAGQFVIQNVPRDGNVRLRAECNGAVAETPLEFKNNLPIRLAFPPGKILIKSLIVTDAAGDNLTIVHRAKPGQVVRVAADVAGAEGEKLHFRWRASDAAHPLEPEDRGWIEWPLPAYVAGTHTMYLDVTNERGEHRIASVSIETGDSDAIFSGTIKDSKGGPLAGATVSVNANSTTTNDIGFFFLQLPEENLRYVLNVQAEGFGLFSRVLYRDGVGGEIRLRPAHTSKFDPAETIYTGDGDKGAGLRISIDEKSLADDNGNRAAEPLTLAITVIDLREPGSLPGNFGAVDVANQPVRLKSVYGAVDVRIRDSSGRPYKLAPGRTATIGIPVNPAQSIINPPTTAPLWRYDEEAGLWRQVGMAVLTGSYYEAKVDHLSVFAVGLAATDAACMRLHVDPGTVILPINLTVLIPANNTTVPICRPSWCRLPPPALINLPSSPRMNRSRCSSAIWN
jgi:hypothetical protein